jgi:glucose-6-phosphate-specific signal transduction histidine kinase
LIGIWAVFWGLSSQVVQIAPCFNLMLRISMRGAISLLPFCYVLERFVENVLFLQEYRKVWNISSGKMNNVLWEADPS